VTRPRFTLAALSWASPRTTARSLTSWAPLARSDLCAQRLIYFQERTPLDDRLAAEHGFEPFGDDENIGIGPAYRRLIDRATADHFLYLECDWKALDPRGAVHHVAAAQRVLDDGIAVVRLRSRRRPGWPVNPSTMQNRELEYPYWLLEMAFWEPRPDEVYPSLISRRRIAGEDWLVAKARFAGWTNNPHLARTAFLRTNVRPFTFGTGRELEGLIDRYWEQLEIDVAQGDGAFTHARVDGPGYRCAANRKAWDFLRLRLGRLLRWQRRRHRQVLFNPTPRRMNGPPGEK
jgi:hypothetical protein